MRNRKILELQTPYCDDKATDWSLRNRRQFRVEDEATGAFELGPNGTRNRRIDWHRCEKLPAIILDYIKVSRLLTTFRHSNPNEPKDSRICCEKRRKIIVKFTIKVERKTQKRRKMQKRRIEKKQNTKRKEEEN